MIIVYIYVSFDIVAICCSLLILLIVAVLLLCCRMIIFVENPAKEVLVEMHVRLRFFFNSAWCCRVVTDVYQYILVSEDVFPNTMVFKCRLVWFSDPGWCHVKRSTDSISAPSPYHCIPVDHLRILFVFIWFTVSRAKKAPRNDGTVLGETTFCQCNWKHLGMTL